MMNVKLWKCGNVKITNVKLAVGCWLLAASTIPHFAPAAPLPLAWRADWPNCKPVEKLLHRGVDVALQPTFYINGSLADTNGWAFSTYVQTNAVGAWFGPLPGAYFSHTNDVGAAFYSVMVRAETPGGNVNYTAFARFRMLDSPGFLPGELPLPAKVIDFAEVSALNPPWSTPADLAAATNAAMTALYVVATKQDLLPYPTNAIPYSAIANAPDFITTNEMASGHTPWVFSDGIDREIVLVENDWEPTYPKYMFRIEYEYDYYYSFSNDAEPSYLEFKMFYDTPAPPPYNSPDFTASRLVWPTMSDLAGRASTNEVVLSPVYGGDGKVLSDWTVYCGGVDVTARVAQPAWNSAEGWWDVSNSMVGDDVGEGFSSATESAMRLDWQARPDGGGTLIYYTAVRVENPAIGYILGSQTNKVLAAPSITNGLARAADLAAVRAVADAAASTNTVAGIAANLSTNYYTRAETDDLNSSLSSLLSQMSSSLTNYTDAAFGVLSTAVSNLQLQVTIITNMLDGLENALHVINTGTNL